jgi:hypothetical protein
MLESACMPQAGIADSARKQTGGMKGRLGQQADLH